MPEEPMMSPEPIASDDPGHGLLPASLADDVRAVSNITVDRRARLALELAVFAVERSVESADDAITLGRQLRAVAEACTEATVLANGLIGRQGPGRSA